MKTINRNSYVTLHFGRGYDRTSFCVLHLGKETEFSNPFRGVIESIPIKISAIANPEMIVSALQDRGNFGTNGFSIYLNESLNDLRSLKGFASRGELLITLHKV